MTVWLYQMNPQRELEDGYPYTPDNFREALASEVILTWLTREIRPRNLEPKAGDTLIYWFVVSGTEEPGIYGVGTIQPA